MNAARLVVGVDGNRHEDVLHRGVGRVAIVRCLVPPHSHAPVAHKVGQLHESVRDKSPVPLVSPVLDLLGEGAVVECIVVIGIGLSCDYNDN